MRKNYIPYIWSIIFFVAALLGITLLGAFIYGAVAGIRSGADLFRAPLFYRTVADALFFEGGIILTFGAFVEFFLKAHSFSLARRIMLPYSLMSRIAAQGDAGLRHNAPGGSGAGADDEAQKTYSGGWMLIFAGALLAIFSFVFALKSLK